MIEICTNSEDGILTELEITGDQANLEQFVTHVLAAIERGSTTTTIDDCHVIINRVD